MDRDDIVRKLDQYVRETFGIEEDDPDYSVDVNLFEEGYADSIDAMRIIMFAEETFGVKITQKDIVRYPINSVSNIAYIVEQKKGQEQ